MTRTRCTAPVVAALALWACASAERTETVQTEPEPRSAPGGAAGVGMVTARDGYVLPSGYEFPVRISSELSTEHAKVGDRVFARVAQNLSHEGHVVVAEGSQVQGTVTRVDDADPGQESRSYLEVDFDTLLKTDGTQYPIQAEISQYQGRFENDTDDTLKGAAVGAGAGAVLGQIIAGDAKGTVLGAVLGGAAGAVIQSQTAGQDVAIPAGTTLWLRMERPVTIR